MKNTKKSESEILRQKAEELLKKKSEAKILELIEELAFQNEEKTKRADELLIANKELAFQNEEKEKRAAELIIANKELAFQQDNLKKIASRVPGLVYQYLMRPDGTSCFPYASEAIRDIFRVSPDEVREDASKVFANIHPDDLAGVFASTQASAQKLTPWQHEYRVKFNDGTIRSIYGNAVPQREEDGSVLWHGFISDITDRKLVEDELRIKEERYRLLAENTRDVVYTMNLDGTITYVSPAVELLRGLTVEEAMNQPLDKILTPDSQAISIDYVVRLCAAIESGSPLPTFHGELEYYRKDMSTLMTESYTYPVLGSDGSSITMLGVTRDITERKKAETALFKAKEDAEVANKAKSTFLANMSHEIRTPLNAIIGFSQLMNREKLLTDTQKEYNTAIYQAGEHLLKLINDILELSKIEAGRAELKPANFDLHAVLNDIQMMFKEQAISKQLQLIVETAGDLPHHVIADDHKLRQILINLIGNAIKFTDLGSIVVRARVEKWRKETSRLIIEIKDSGPGISEDELGKLFKQFEQTTAGINSTRGTGLGLALSRELAILMGGNISVASEVGKGSVFTINVEIKEGEPEVLEASITKRVKGIDNPKDTYRVLIVDDKKENRHVMGSFLRLAGFETKEAVNGKDAISKFEQWDPHLILMDMRMPVMNGYEATRHIKSTEKGKQTPVIAITASSLEDEKKNVLNLDLQGYIPKPFRESAFFETIGRVLGIKYIYEEETSPNALSRNLINDGIVDAEIAKLPEEAVLQMQHASLNSRFIPNILMVDDIGTNLKLLNDILVPEGFKTRPVPNGELALLAAEKEKPDLILLDIMMPGMDGFEVCRRLKENPGLSDIPVIFISALGDTDNIVKALTTGGVDYINKPFQAEEVVARVYTQLKMSRQSKELRELNATKDKFFSIISHDLRGPFSGFLGLSKMLAENLPGLTQAEIQKMSGALRDSATNLFGLLENLLEWSRMQQGGIIFNPELTRLISIMTKSMHPIMDSAYKKGVEIKYEIPADLEVFADEYMIDSTIRNLASNAAKFTRKGGKVTIAAKVIPGNSVEISVSDTGIGMSPEMVVDLFRLDVQTNRRGTENEPSTGLGLILCKDFIERHGGKIWVESEEGRGSAFCFTIPAAPPQNQ